MTNAAKPTQNRASFRLDDIPPDRKDGSSSWVHQALRLTGYIGRIPAGLLAPLWVGLTLLSAWPWGQLRIWAGAGFVMFFTTDAAMLALLPVTRRSWGPVTPPLAGLTFVRAAIFGVIGWLAPSLPALCAASCLNLAISVVATYATWIEPFRIAQTTQEYTVSTWAEGAPIRMLHISDIHFERFSLRETRLQGIVGANPTDLLLLTGDYLNLSSVYDPAAQQGVHDLLARLAPQFPSGAYAITGSPVVDRENVVPRIFSDLPIRWLVDEGAAIEVAGHPLWLMGVRCTYELERDAQALQMLLEAAPADMPCILLYHTPDLMPKAAELGVDLYLCGHTHGGQIQLPWYGAIATSSRWGKRYEAGRYQENRTTLYVSRGLGLEGLGAPRARFLAPPEAIVWTLNPTLRD